MYSTLTNLTQATTWSGTDLFYALVGGNSRKIAASSMFIAEAANVLSDVNGTNAQTVRVYRTFTDSSNYERLALQSGGSYFEIAAQTAGTGTDNLDVRLTPAGTGRVDITSATGISAPMHVTNTTTASGFGGIGNFYCSGLAAGQKAFFTFGKDSTDGIVLGFAFTATGDGTNKGSFEFVGANTIISFQKAGTVQLFESNSVAAGGSTNNRVLLGGGTQGIYVGSGAPTVSAAKGSIYLRSDGSTTNDRLYVNTNGSTTWTNVTTAA